MTIVQPTPCMWTAECDNLAVATAPTDQGRRFICTSCIETHDVDELMVGCSPAKLGDVQTLEAFAERLARIGKRGSN